MRHHSQWSPLARALGATGDHWTLLIALQLMEPDVRRPVQLQRQLAGISNGVLDRHLQQMVSLGLLLRRRYREMPPRVELALTEAGRELLPIAAGLARWGMRHLWSSPEARERVDIDALLGLLPALLEGARRLPEGTLELTVEDPEQASTTRRFEVDQGRVRALDNAGEERPAARVVGDTQSWIAALGPERDYAGLRFAGRKGMARKVLEALPGAPTGG